MAYNHGMALPVIHYHQRHSQQDLLRLFQQTDARWAEQIARPHTLDLGVAYTNAAMAAVTDANHIREAILPQGMPASRAVELVDAHFAGQGARCGRWVMNVAATEPQIRPLVEHLSSLGYLRSEIRILRLARMPKLDLTAPAGLKTIPARSSYRHMRELATECAEKRNQPQLADAAMRRLDDPLWEPLLAIRDGIAIATGGVLTVGEIGRIDQVYVSQSVRRQGLGRLMLARILEICARAMFRHVMAAAPAGDTTVLRLLEESGFEPIGTMVTMSGVG